MGASVTNLRRHDESFADDASMLPLEHDSIKVLKVRDREEYALREKQVDTTALRTQLIGECPVCLDVFSADIMPCLLVCGHRICETCVKKLHHVRCPMCRAKFEDMPMRDEMMCKYIDAVTLAAPTLAAIDIKPFIEAKLLQTWEDVSGCMVAITRIAKLTEEKEKATLDYRTLMDQYGVRTKSLTEELCANAKDHQKELQKLQRKIDTAENEHNLWTIEVEKIRKECADARKDRDYVIRSRAALEASLQATIRDHGEVIRKMKDRHETEMRDLTRDYNRLHLMFEQQVNEDGSKYSSLERKYESLTQDYDWVTQKVLFHQEASLNPNNAFVQEAETTMRQMRRFIELILQENDELRYRDELCQNLDLHRVYDEICARRSKLEEEMRMIHLHNKHILTRELKSAINQRDCVKGWSKHQTQLLEKTRKERDAALKELSLLKAQKSAHHTNASAETIIPDGNNNNVFPVQLTAESVPETEQPNDWKSKQVVKTPWGYNVTHY